MPDNIGGAPADLSYLPDSVVDPIKQGDSKIAPGLADTILTGPLSAVKFRVEGMSPARSGVFNGADINYLAVGQIYAAHGDSVQEMNGDIQSWNEWQSRGRYLGRLVRGGGTDYDLKQIPQAKKWARLGYEFYNQNAIK